MRADAAVIATETGKIQETFEKQRFEEMPLIGDGRTPDAVLISLPMVQNAGGVYSVQMAGQPGARSRSVRTAIPTTAPPTRSTTITIFRKWWP